MLNLLHNFIKDLIQGNSSSYITTELQKLLTPCLTAIKTHLIRYGEIVYERSGKTSFLVHKKSGEVHVLNKH